MLRTVNQLKMHVLWHVTPCILVHIYQRWRGTYWLGFQMTPNVEELSFNHVFLPNYTLSHPRKYYHGNHCKKCTCPFRQSIGKNYI